MGTAAVGSAVESGSLSVRGVSGLRIVDLSIMSEPIDIHPMETAMAIGLILGTHHAPQPRR
jgi:choline dehydrogenase-like flavoprotein